MAEKIMNYTAKGVKETIEIALASQLDPIRKDIASIRDDVKGLKMEVRGFNSKLDTDRRMTIIETELREVKRKVGQRS